MRLPSRGLYALTPDESDTARLIEQVQAALRGGAVMVQYRQKRAAAALARQAASTLLTLCRSHGVPLIVNDDLALAATLGADGVHVGRADASVAHARDVLGPRAIVGASCYDSLELAREAVSQGASYVAFGSVFPSPTKPSASRVSLDLLTTARAELEVPICAIGGITPDNAAAVIAAGADLLAVVSGLFEMDDPCAAASRYRALFSP